MIALILVGLSATVSPANAAPTANSPVCVATDFRRDALPSFIRDALGVLRQSGHLAADYRLELRVGDPTQPGLSPFGRGPATSVVFIPRNDDAYPVRVSPRQPCVLTWVWQPDRFTPWQREALERAGRQFARQFEAVAENAMVEVYESSTELAFEVLDLDVAADGTVDRPWIRLLKADLTPID